MLTMCSLSPTSATTPSGIKNHVDNSDFWKAFDKATQHRLLNKQMSHQIRWKEGKMEGPHQWDLTGLSAETRVAHQTQQWPLVKFRGCSYTNSTKIMYGFTQSKVNCKEFQKALTILHDEVIKWHMKYNIHICKIIHTGEKTHPSYEQIGDLTELLLFRKLV